MVERHKIVEFWRRGHGQTLVTLVGVEGSSYRQPGACMLIGSDGNWAGSVSGGCLETEVVRKAAWLARNGAVVERYSTLFDDTAEIPYGLGCGGAVHLLLEPTDTAEFTALMEAMEASLRGEQRRALTQLPDLGRALRRCILGAGGLHLFRSAEGFVDVGLPHFDERLNPPQRLFVIGAGDDAQPVVQMAALLGWNVTVIDGRAQWARAERFPAANRVVALAAESAPLIASGDAVVIMTHSYEQDRDWLVAVLPQGPQYLGLLGARHRSALLIADAAERLGWSLERICDRLFAPVGLDLGGDGAEAIALSIIAEVQACCQARLGSVRRLTAEIISEQLSKGGASRYVQTRCLV